MVKLRDGRILPLYRIKQNKEEQDMWYTHYERKIMKNTILRHSFHLDVTYAHINHEHIVAIKNAEKNREVIDKCWYLITLPRQCWREGVKYHFIYNGS